MKKYLLTFGGKEFGWSRHNDEGVFRDYYAEAERLVDSAKKWDLIPIHYDKSLFDTNPDYYPKYKETLDRSGFGFAFKPIGFWETLKIMDEGDCALFVDSNHIIKKDPEEFYYIIDNNSVFAQDHIWNYYPNKDWTHRDTFVNMGCDEARYWNAPEMHCCITGIKKDEFGMKFAKEYLDYCLDWRVTFGEGKHKDFASFKENRHNQSVFSIMVEKYNLSYLNREQNVWMEYIIPELDFIRETNPIDFSYRKEQDRKEIR
jgi:hypothetical protein